MRHCRRCQWLPCRVYFRHFRPIWFSSPKKHFCVEGVALVHCREHLQNEQEQKQYLPLRPCSIETAITSQWWPRTLFPTLYFRPWFDSTDIPAPTRINCRENLNFRTKSFGFFFLFFFKVKLRPIGHPQACCSQVLPCCVLCERSHITNNALWSRADQHTTVSRSCSFLGSPAHQSFANLILCDATSISKRDFSVWRKAFLPSISKRNNRGSTFLNATLAFLSSNGPWRVTQHCCSCKGTGTRIQVLFTRELYDIISAA